MCIPVFEDAMLRLTDQAADHLVNVRRERNLGAKAMPRFSRRAGKLVLKFVESPSEGDRLIHGGRISVLVAEDAVVRLESAFIDAKSKEGRTYLVVRKSSRDEAHAPRASRASGRRPKAVGHPPAEPGASSKTRMTASDRS
jgi:hypothetical protein